MNKLTAPLKPVFEFRWKPSLDLAVVVASYLLVVGALYTTTVIVGAERGGGIPYFLLYAVVTALLFGVCVPIGWMVFVRKRPLADLGLTFKNWPASLALQLVFSVILIITGPKLGAMSFAERLPLIALVLCIGFFEALFWRGWVLNRLEESFGFIPALILGSAMYSVYHIGYEMPWNEMFFLFFIGIMFAVVFRMTKSVLILWPLFQPWGQLITLTKEGLSLPTLASLGFFEVLAAMLVVIWLAGKYLKRVDKKRARQVEIRPPQIVLE